MGYRAYPEMRDSGVPWLGEIPPHWEPKRLRFALQTNPSANEINLEQDALVSFIPMDAVGESGGLRLDTDKPLSEIGTGYTYFANGDVVVAKITPCFENGKGAIAEGLTNGIAFGTTELHVLRADSTLDKRFLFYLTTSQTFHALGESEMYGAGGQKRVPDSFIKNFRAALPPLPEQQTIARLLDHKTAQIDALIAKKETLLQKLAEKRTTLISQAVTRGLDPTVPMQDSGVAWLGKIPAHWGMTRLKYATALIVDCPHDTPQYSPEGDFLVVRTADLSSGVMDLSSAYRVDEDEYLKRIRRAEVKPCDILYGREGERWGFAAEVPDEPMVCLGQRMMQFRASAHFCPHYLMWHLNADCVYQQGVVDTYGSTAPHVNVETIKNYWLVEPPLAEQEAIAKHLDAVTKKFAKQVAAARRAIATLSEYRAALITAAVTGKIDVRGVPLPTKVSP